MIIQMDLSRHCIETASRLAREALVRTCLRETSPENEARLRLLTHFLEQTDFPALRTRIDQAATGSRTATLVFPDPSTPQRLQIHMGNRIILPVWNA